MAVVVGRFFSFAILTTGGATNDIRREFKAELDAIAGVGTTFQLVGTASGNRNVCLVANDFSITSAGSARFTNTRGNYTAIWYSIYIGAISIIDAYKRGRFRR